MNLKATCWLCGVLIVGMTHHVASAAADALYLPARDHQFIGAGYVMRRDWDFMVRNLLGREPPPGYRIGVDHR